MWRRILILAVAVQLAATLPASAGIIFNRKAKPAPAQRVPELIGILKGDPNEGKREAAADELRQYDPKAYPEIVPVLMDAAQRDAKPEVRAEAVQSLGKLRPVSQEVGLMFEQVLANDSSNKVKWQARTALLQYQMSGYRKGKQEGPAVVPQTTTQEPPLAEPVPPQPPRIAPVPTPSQPVPVSPVSRPLPTGPAQPQLVPTQAPVFKTPPANDGPMLSAPK